MANASSQGLYGINFKDNVPGVSGISLQFHITANCDQMCQHCYMYNSPFYKGQIQAPLNLKQIYALIDEYFAFLGQYNTVGYIALTGGDPLLSPHFFDLLKYINVNYGNKGIVTILGNPYHVFECEAKRMRELGVLSYQISLDGLRDTHDKYRRKGSFDDSLRALQILHKAGIKTLVGFTLSKTNEQELLPLLDFLSEQPYVDAFGFDRLVPTGNGAEMIDDLFSPEEYKHLLFNIYLHEVFTKPRLIVGKKDQMWRPLFFELGLFDPIDKQSQKSFANGCTCGTSTISVLADGTVLPCRRIDLASGKYPEKTLRQLIVDSEVTKMFRDYKSYKGCNTCSANRVCKGCAAMKYAATGDFFSKDPNCWR